MSHLLIFFQGLKNQIEVFSTLLGGRRWVGLYKQPSRATSLLRLVVNETSGLFLIGTLVLVGGCLRFGTPQLGGPSLVLSE